MEILLIIIVALLLIIAVVVVFNFLGNRRMRQAQAEALHQRAYGPADPFSTADDDAVRGDPRHLKPGDLVELRGQTYAVRGTLRLSQSGFVWTENFLDTGSGSKLWLSVEDDPDLEVVAWQELSGVTLSPGPATVDLDGRRYISDESGSAEFESAGTTGLAPRGSMRYHDYEAGDQRLSFEDFGSGWECARGEVVARSEYRIYPANPAPGP
ncbi:DUF4178 domain-containing protein [Gordonia rhizosphera]|uniref:DUF4178 domain-containing protein n=1 Tax=Gordonia rhizosphera NBRC 16068 TaxID=1108045 RepID=K6WQZ7_9ACTN|nr:DUF4178 domain-containing protein [Gordonia rhizosphera]GAB88979.1 hypothetical protein GORHZ_046_01310 [Gordonia rhizosphera NBRC 16068]